MIGDLGIKKQKRELFPLSAESEARIFIIIIFTYLFTNLYVYPSLKPLYFIVLKLSNDTWDVTYLLPFL